MSFSDSNKKDRPSVEREMIELTKEDFKRLDEMDDAIYYAIERPGPHLDSLALNTVERVIKELIVEDEPVILDLMAGIDSHIPDSIKVREVVGLGLNDSELKKNGRLSSYRVHDLNREPRLPFAEDTFDVVINTVSVDYMTQPFVIFEEVSRILKPGGLFLVIFSDRYFPEKAVKVWKQGSEEERILFVEEFFRRTPGFEKLRLFISKGWPRPKGDRYSDLGIPSDPVYVLYSEKAGKPEGARARPDLMERSVKTRSKAEIDERKKQVGSTLCCPHCDQKLSKWKVPINPFMEWENEFMYICFNDLCSYYLDGWDAMAQQGNHGISYRYMYNPINGTSLPVPVHSPRALKSGVIEE